jgi:hypothetical protein
MLNVFERRRIEEEAISGTGLSALLLDEPLSLLVDDLPQFVGDRQRSAGRSAVSLRQVPPLASR